MGTYATRRMFDLEQRVADLERALRDLLTSIDGASTVDEVREAMEAARAVLAQRTL